MKDKIHLTIEKLDSKGRGLARLDGQVFFVPWAVPGDRVLVQIGEGSLKYKDGRILDIVEKSPDRIHPECPYFFECGGCQLQHINYPAQLRWKQQIVVDHLRRLQIPTEKIKPILPSSQIWNYRNRIQLQSDRTGRVGFYKRESHQIVEIQECRIAEPSLNDRLKNIRSHPQSVLRFPHEIRSDQTTNFAQVNTLQNEQLIQTVLEFSEPKPQDSIVDLYCGSGNFTFPLASLAHVVCGIEKNRDAISQAKFLASEKRVKNIHWISAGAYRGLKEIFDYLKKVDTLVADPPRRGMAEALASVLKIEPKRIIYVSCNPDTFSHEVAHLIKAGYELVAVQPLDMFPHTAHVEVVGHLVKRVQ